MKIYIKLAFRNLLRHSRRTMVCLAMIVGAFCALVIFHGFSQNVLRRIERGSVESMYGHLQVAKREYFDRTPVKNQRDNFLAGPTELMAEISRLDSVEYASGRLSFYSLIANDDVSVSARGIAIEVAKETGIWNQMRILEGERLSPSADREILIGHRLNYSIHAKPGDKLSLVTSTLDGTVNGIDVTVRGIFAIGVTEIDDFVFFIPHTGAHRLIDADSFETLVIKLKDRDALPAAQSQVKVIADKANLEVKNWRDLAVLFKQVEQFWNTQSVIILSILGILIFLGIANTVSMTIVERTTEIGTLRALGFEKTDIRIIFMLESFLMGIAGILVAIPVCLLIIAMINASGVELFLPASSIPMELRILLTAKGFQQAILTALSVPLIATIPALRMILKKSIVDSLRLG